MKIITLIILIFVLMISSICRADEDSLQKAYSLYYQGKMEEAISFMKDYVDERPDPKVLYFIGYAYYKKKNMEMARRYFEEAYLIDPDFSPVKR